VVATGIYNAIVQWPLPKRDKHMANNNKGKIYYTQIPNFLKLENELSAYDIGIYFYLKSFLIGDSGTVYPGKKRMKIETKSSNESINKSIKVLEKKGLIRRGRKRIFQKKGGTQWRITYEILDVWKENKEQVEKYKNVIGDSNQEHPRQGDYDY